MLHAYTFVKEEWIQKAEGSVCLFPLLYRQKTQALSLCQQVFDFWITCELHTKLKHQTPVTGNVERDPFTITGKFKSQLVSAGSQRETNASRGWLTTQDTSLWSQQTWWDALWTWPWVSTDCKGNCGDKLRFKHHLSHI